MIVGVVREKYPGERRVALIPSNTQDILKIADRVLIEAGSGMSAGYDDKKYLEKGAAIEEDRKKILASCDVLLSVRSVAALKSFEAGAQDIAVLKDGATVIGNLNPYQPHPLFDKMAEKNMTAFSMELIPRITRAQSMDVLSSMANLAGYKAVLLGATTLSKMFPMMMTAAGTVVPSRVFVVGAGVAGLQAVATARRLGALVSAYDVRPAVKEQVESLGAKFVDMKLETDQAEGSGGYARKMDEEFYRKQRELMTSVLVETDVVITTAAIPGKPAPVLITAEMASVLPKGSVIVDLAAERGGNCELTRPGETVEIEGVTILGPLNLPASLPYHASQLFSKNITVYLAHIVEQNGIEDTPKDEIIQASRILHKGELIYEQIIRKVDT